MRCCSTAWQRLNGTSPIPMVNLSSAAFHKSISASLRPRDRRSRRPSNAPGRTPPALRRASGFTAPISRPRSTCAAIEGPTRDDAAALTALEAIAREPFDGPVGVAGISRATLLFKLGKQPDADAADAGPRSTPGSHRNVRCERGGRPRRWQPIPADMLPSRLSANWRLVAPRSGVATRSSSPHRFPMSSHGPISRVKLADGTVSQVQISQDLPGFPQTIYVAPDEVTLLSRLITTFGGTKTRATVEVMETPNQPVGSAVDVMRFWTRYFPTRQEASGRMGGGDVSHDRADRVS